MRPALGFKEPLDDQLVAKKDLRAFLLEKSWIDLQVFVGLGVDGNHRLAPGRFPSLCTLGQSIPKAKEKLFGCHGRSRRGLLLIQPVNQQAQETEVDAVEGEAEAGEMGDFGFVGFLREGVAQKHFAGRIDDAEEFLAEMVELLFAQRALEADDEVGPDEAIRVEVVIELED